jgi:hypothetical protein
MKILEGKKTFIGLGVLLIGALGLANIISPEEWEKGVNLILELVGLVIAVYGRIKAKGPVT